MMSFLRMAASAAAQDAAPGQQVFADQKCSAFGSV
jgi:hypothetical protein